MKMLWIVQMVLLVYGIVRPKHNAARHGSQLQLSIRMLLSISLVISAFFLWMYDNGSDFSYRQWVFWGMLLSFVGDLSMAKVIPWRQHLIAGMIAFAAAHVFYITAFMGTITVQGKAFSFFGFFAALLGYIMVLAVCWLYWIRNPQQSVLINIGALIYGLWVSGMSCFAFVFAIALGGVWWLAAIGGFLFVVSDLIIGITSVGTVQMKHSEIWIWLTYVTAQMGIIYAGVLT